MSAARRPVEPEEQEHVFLRCLAAEKQQEPVQAAGTYFLLERVAQEWHGLEVNRALESAHLVALLEDLSDKLAAEQVDTT